jgi:HAD superfamily hydrolase (TIGR01509 family)
VSLLLFGITNYNERFDFVLWTITAYLIASGLVIFFRSLRKYFLSSAVAFDAGGVFFVGTYATEEVKPRKGMVKLINKLKSKHIVALATNQNFFAHMSFEKRYRFDELFDVQVVSGKIGVKKPDPKYFQIMLKKLRVKPQDCAFIDDSPENVESAAGLGINAIQFQSLEQISEELKKLGFL